MKWGRRCAGEADVNAGGNCTCFCNCLHCKHRQGCTRNACRIESGIRCRLPLNSVVSCSLSQHEHVQASCGKEVTAAGSLHPCGTEDKDKDFWHGDVPIRATHVTRHQGFQPKALGCQHMVVIPRWV
jgi:hypothetical protein